MTVVLRPMTDDEFPAYLASSIERYAADMTENGGLLPDAARAKSEADHAELYSAGRETEGMDSFVVEADGAGVGCCVLGRRERHGRTVAFVYDIWIEPERRGRGLGRRTMELLGDRACELALQRIELNVFGGNTVARELYRSLGYQEIAVMMGKDLT